jgi:BirA family biotin operon repressor/biotin-[acetyl-CoA-carboxylase] ligase
LRYRAQVASTNDLALALALAGEPEGTSVLADQQTRGRGRRGRTWHSPAEAGLYLSVIARPPAAEALPLVTLGAGVAVTAAVRATSGLPAELKWPNDVVIGRPWRKLGGVLSEAASSGDRLEAVVIGIGLNVRQSRLPREILGRATAVEAELGRPVERGPLLVEILRELRGVLGWLHAGDAERVRTAWRQFAAAALANPAVRWRDGDRVRRGRARDIDRDGALLVECDGRLERIVAGEVVWESFAHE